MMRTGAPLAKAPSVPNTPALSPTSTDAGHDDLHRLAAALRVEDFQVEAVLLEDAGLLAELGDGAFPAAADRRRDLQGLRGKPVRDQQCGERGRG